MAGGETDAALAGCHILVTRPAHQAHELCTMIERAGGRVYSMPVIEIAEPRDPQALYQLLDRLEEFDIAVFISSNAVHRACALVAGRRGWPPALRFAVVGSGSAEALAQHGLHAWIRPPHDFNSEGLLAMAELHAVAGRKVIIFRGEAGRDLLAGTLRVRGAQVEYADVYRRCLPPDGRAALHHIVTTGRVDAIVVTSNEGLRNLYQLAAGEDRAWLLDRQLVVISKRGAELAGELGFRLPARIAAEASDRGLLEAIRAWWQGQSEASGGTYHEH